MIHSLAWARLAAAALAYRSSGRWPGFTPEAPRASPAAVGGLRVTVAFPAALAQLPVAANQPAFGAPNTNTMGAMHG